MGGSQRNNSFDILKGIGILLMLVGHIQGIPHWMHQFIYSFHMPLFFLVAGWFFKDCKESEKFYNRVAKDFKRLIVPFVFTQVLLILWTCVLWIFKGDASFFYRALLSLCWGGDDVVIVKYGQIHVGPIWFLAALFVSRTIFGGLQSLGLFRDGKNSSFLLLVCIALSIIANFLHDHIKLPWSILQGVSALVFIAIGWFSKRVVSNLTSKCWIYCFIAVSWIPSIIFAGIEMSSCDYSIYPLAVVGSCGGTILFYYLSSYLSKCKEMRFISLLFAWCGRYSLPILCFHTLDSFSAIAYSINCRLPIPLERGWMIVFRYSLTFLCTIIAANVPVFKSVFSPNYSYKIKHDSR